MWKRLSKNIINSPVWSKHALINAFVLFVLGFLQYEFRTMGFFTPKYYLYSPLVALAFFFFIWKPSFYDKNDHSFINIFILSAVSAILISYTTELAVGITELIYFECFDELTYGITEPFSLPVLAVMGLLRSLVNWHMWLTIFILNMMLGLITFKNLQKNNADILSNK